MAIVSWFPEDALLLSGGEMRGEIRMGGHKISGIEAPEASDDAVNKGYVDDMVGNIESLLSEI